MVLIPLLSGSVRDTRPCYLCRGLMSLGWPLDRKREFSLPKSISWDSLGRTEYVFGTRRVSSSTKVTRNIRSESTCIWQVTPSAQSNKTPVPFFSLTSAFLIYLIITSAKSSQHPGRAGPVWSTKLFLLDDKGRDVTYGTWRTEHHLRSTRTCGRHVEAVEHQICRVMQTTTAPTTL